MDAREDGNSSTAGANNGTTEDDTHWKALISTIPGRKHVDELLDHSDASFSKEFYKRLHVQAGWEEALQKKCKKAKAGDNDYHCQLCIDVKLSQNPEPDFSAGSESSEANCSSAEECEKGFAVPTKHQSRSSSSPSEMCCQSTELHGYKHRGKAMSRVEFGDKMTNAFRQTVSSIAIKSVLDEEKKMLDLKFPAGQGSSLPWSTMEVTRRIVGACSLGTADSLMAEKGSDGIPVSMEVQGEEATADLRMDNKVSEDNYRLFTRPCHLSRNVLSVFSSEVPQSYVTSSDALPQATGLGRKIKYNNKHKMSAKSPWGHRTRRTEPNLPVLLGTRVPILSASHRILYPP